MFLTSSEPVNWLPMVIFALFVALITILIGKFLFKRKPIWIFAIPGTLLVFGGILFGMGFLIETWDKLAAFLFGILLMLAGGGATIGALIVYFLIHKAHQKISDSEDLVI
jgi:hypothetical protein